MVKLNYNKLSAAIENQNVQNQTNNEPSVQVGHDVLVTGHGLASRVHVSAPQAVEHHLPQRQPVNLVRVVLRY